MNPEERVKKSFTSKPTDQLRECRPVQWTQIELRMLLLVSVSSIKSAWRSCAGQRETLSVSIIQQRTWYNNVSNMPFTVLHGVNIDAERKVEGYRERRKTIGFCNV